MPTSSRTEPRKLGPVDCDVELYMKEKFETRKKAAKAYSITYFLGALSVSLPFYFSPPTMLLVMGMFPTGLCILFGWDDVALDLLIGYSLYIIIFIAGTLKRSRIFHYIFTTIVVLNIGGCYREIYKML